MRALIFCGGGAVGIKWERGVAAGILPCGVDLHRTELKVGTTAG